MMKRFPPRKSRQPGMRVPASETPAASQRRQEKQLRTCLGCGAKDRQEHLLPLAFTGPGRVGPDVERRLPGRHVYCCRTEVCLKRLMKNRKRVARALRAEAVEFDEGLQSLFGSVVA